MRKKVLFIVQLPPPIHGASLMNKYLIDFATNNPSLISKVLPLKFVDRINQIGQFSLKKAFLTLEFSLKLLLVIIKFKPDLVYYTLAPRGGAFYRDTIFVSIVKLFRIKILFHLHGKGISKQIRNKPWQILLYKFTFKNTAIIHLAKSLTYDIDRIMNNSNKIFIIPNGIPKVKLNNLQNIDGNSNEKVKIIYLSNLVKTKGILILIDALKILKTQGFSFQAVIIGNSADVTIEELRSLVYKMNLMNEVEILGPVYGVEKFNYLNKSDIFVFPTYFENECFPLSILEAMQMGNAIISTDNGAIKEIVSENINGFIVNQKDPHELAEKVARLIDNRKLLEKMKSENKRAFILKYSIERFEQSILKTIHLAIKSEKRN